MAFMRLSNSENLNCIKNNLSHVFACQTTVTLFFVAVRTVYQSMHDRENDRSLGYFFHRVLFYHESGKLP